MWGAGRVNGRGREGVSRRLLSVFYPSSIRLYARWMGPVLTFWFGALVDAARDPSLLQRGQVARKDRADGGL